MNHCEGNALSAHPVFAAQEGGIFADHDARDLVQDCCAAAHGAGAEGADESESVPIAAATGRANAGGFGVGGGVAGLDTQVVATGQDLARGVHEDRADGNAAFREGLFGLLDRGIEGGTLGGRDGGGRGHVSSVSPEPRRADNLAWPGRLSQ